MVKKEAVIVDFLKRIQGRHHKQLLWSPDFFQFDQSLEILLQAEKINLVSICCPNWAKIDPIIVPYCMNPDVKQYIKPINFCTPQKRAQRFISEATCFFQALSELGITYQWYFSISDLEALNLAETGYFDNPEVCLENLYQDQARFIEGFQNNGLACQSFNEKDLALLAQPTFFSYMSNAQVVRLIYERDLAVIPTLFPDNKYPTIWLDTQNNDEKAVELFQKVAQASGTKLPIWRIFLNAGNWNKRGRAIHAEDFVVNYFS